MAFRQHTTNWIAGPWFPAGPSHSSRPRRRGRERRVKRGVVFVERFRLVQRRPGALHPGVRFEFFIVLADAYAQFSNDASPAQQPPQRERFFKACGMACTVTDRRAHHAHCQISAVGRGRICFVAVSGKKPLKECLRLAKSTQPQTQSYQRKQSRCAQKNPARPALQRTKPPKPFPHLLAGFGAARCRRAVPGVL